MMLRDYSVCCIGILNIVVLFLIKASTAAKSTDERKQDTPSNGLVAQQDNKSGEDTGVSSLV